MHFSFFFFGEPRKSPHTVGTFSGLPESLPTLPARFRNSPKVSPHRRRIFGTLRKSPHTVGTFSGLPEEQKNVSSASFHL